MFKSSAMAAENRGNFKHPESFSFNKIQLIIATLKPNVYSEVLCELHVNMDGPGGRLNDSKIK